MPYEITPAQEAKNRCPSDELLHGYVAGCLTQEQHEALSAHLGDCARCREKAAAGITHAAPRCCRGGLSGNARATLFARMGITPTAGKSFLKKHAWGLCALACFGASFLVKRYFLQWLIATLVVGLKWVIESEQFRTLIMVLESRLKDREPHDEDHARKREIFKR